MSVGWLHAPINEVVKTATNIPEQDPETSLDFSKFIILSVLPTFCSSYLERTTVNTVAVACNSRAQRRNLTTKKANQNKIKRPIGKITAVTA